MDRLHANGVSVRVASADAKALASSDAPRSAFQLPATCSGTGSGFRVWDVGVTDRGSGCWANQRLI